MKPSLAKASTADRENSTLRQQCNALSEQLGRVLLSVPAIGRLLANTTTISSEDLLLTTEEVQEAALRTIWLAHYYGLARDLGVLPELAVAQAERWGSTAPPEEVLHRCAADVARRLREYTQGPGTTSQQQAAADAAAPATTDSPDGLPTSRTRACVADVVELERASRRLEALQVPSQCRGALAQVAQEEAMQPAILSLDALDDLDDPARGSYLPLEPVVPLPAAAGAEIAFCTAWLTYMWGRAALAGIQPQVSLEQAEQWAGRMGKAAQLQDFGDVNDSLQELALYGIEELLWKER